MFCKFIYKHFHCIFIGKHGSRLEDNFEIELQEDVKVLIGFIYLRRMSSNWGSYAQLGTSGFHDSIKCWVFREWLSNC
jgi:hypothetical protein